VTTTINDPELDRRLRATLTAVMPLLDPRSEAGDLELRDVVTLTANPARRHRHRMAGPMAILTAAAVVLLLLVVRTRSVAPGDTTTSNASAVATTTSASAAAPHWYQVLRPFMPDGFDQMALTNASAEALSFRALRMSTGHVLDVAIGAGTGDLRTDLTLRRTPTSTARGSRRLRASGW
jgi:hypothetical protein